MANIDYEEQITQIEEEKQDRLTETEEMYGGMLEQTKQKYDDLAEASKGWVTEQSALQQQQTDFTIDQIEQQKEQTEKDYTKEQSGAYADWKKESNRYGAGAEELAAAGLSDSGYSESSQVQIYNTYQNRVATARAAYDLAVMNYNNAIREAQLQNSSALAEIAYTGLQQQLELALQGLQYENQLLLDLEGQKAQIEDTYHNRYLDVLDQMNADRAFEESVRQYNQNYELEMKEYEEGVRQFDAEMERLKEKDAEEKHQWDLMYAQSGAGITKDDDTTNPVIEAGANAARSATAGQVVSGYYPGKTTTNKEITDFIEKNMPKATTGSYSASSYQQKLANDEKKQQGTGADKSNEPEKYEFGTPYYRGSYNSDIKYFGTFNNGYQPKGISGHGWLEKTGEKEEVHTVIQYGKDAGKEKVVNQNVWKAEDGTKWIWNGVSNSYEEY